MARTFDEFMKEIERETRRAGPAAIARAEALKAQYKLATEIILLRKHRGLTQRQLSARTGIQQSEISRIESGRANPTVSTVAVLGEALGAEFSLRERRRAKSSGSTRGTAGGRRAALVTAARSTPALRRTRVDARRR